MIWPQLIELELIRSAFCPVDTFIELWPRYVCAGMWNQSGPEKSALGHIQIPVWVKCGWPRINQPKKRTKPIPRHIDLPPHDRLKYLQAIFKQIFSFLLDTVDVHLHLPNPAVQCALCRQTVCHIDAEAW